MDSLCQCLNGRKLVLRSIFFSFILGGLVSAAAPPTSSAEGSSGLRRVYQVGPDSHLYLKNYMGSIRVQTGEKDRVVVSANIGDGFVQIDRNDNLINITMPKLRDSGVRNIDFLLTVPPTCALNLDCFRGKVKVDGHRGDIEVATHEGDIELSGIRSHYVKASSINGRIVFDGEPVAGGRYILDSINNIDVWLPSKASFDLIATSERDHIDLGSFGFASTTTERRITARCGDGGAKMQLTSRGSIHLHRR